MTPAASRGRFLGIMYVNFSRVKQKRGFCARLQPRQTRGEPCIRRGSPYPVCALPARTASACRVRADYARCYAANLRRRPFRVVPLAVPRRPVLHAGELSRAGLPASVPRIRSATVRNPEDGRRHDGCAETSASLRRTFFSLYLFPDKRALGQRPSRHDPVRFAPETGLHCPCTPK